LRGIGHRTRHSDKSSRGTVYYTECLSTRSLDPLAGDLSAVEARESGFGDGGGLLNLSVGGGEDDLDVARVTLVGVDATVGTVRAAAGFLG
jgi:hypothetical protein